MQATIAGISDPGTAAGIRVRLLVAQSDAGNSELVVKGLYHGQRRGFLYLGNGMFQPDRQADAALTLDSLLQSAQPGAELTFTGVPIGSGRRLGIDRNGDGQLDGDE